MSQEIDRFELINALQEGPRVTFPVDQSAGNVIPLFEGKSYLELSERFNAGINSHYTELARIEQSRRSDFLDSVSHFEYPQKEDKVNQEIEPTPFDYALAKSENAWNRVVCMMYPDGSEMQGEEISLGAELSKTPLGKALQELNEIFGKINTRFVSIEVAEDSVEEEYRAILRKMHEDEAEKYRLYKDELVEYGREEVAIAVTEDTLTPEVLEEIQNAIFETEILEIEELELAISFVETIALTSLARRNKV